MKPLPARLSKLFPNRRMSTMLTLGFASGLPLALSGSTLQAWLTTSGVKTETIALFSLVGLPYTLKFLWAPVMDRFVPPLFGRRRGWMLLTQCLLIALILGMANTPPAGATLIVGALALALAFSSASQDIAIDAYRADLLHAEERGLGSALSVAGYRIAMLVSGGLALILADHAGWRLTYSVMAALMVVGIVSSLLGPEPTWKQAPPLSLAEAVIQPFSEFLKRTHAVPILIFVVLYKLGDAFALTLSTTFLLRGLHFSLTEVGLISKWMGFAATVIGGLTGGAMMMRFGLYRCLMGFGILQTTTNLGFSVLAMIGKSYAGMIAVIAMENLASGMGTAVFMALLISLCDHRYSATQYALLSAIAVIGRVIVGPPAGLLVESIGWAPFFALAFLVGLPGLGVLAWLRDTVQSYDTDQPSAA